jgi:hypothetical protein
MLENLSSPPLKYIFAIEFWAMQISIDFRVYHMLYLLYIQRRSRMRQAQVKNYRTGSLEQCSRALLKENVKWAKKALGSAFETHAKISLEGLTRKFGFSVNS